MLSPFAEPCCAVLKQEPLLPLFQPWSGRRHEDSRRLGTLLMRGWTLQNPHGIVPPQHPGFIKDDIRAEAAVPAVWTGRVSWFNTGWQLSTMQPLAHSIDPQWDREEIKPVGCDNNSLIIKVQYNANPSTSTNTNTNTTNTTNTTNANTNNEREITQRLTELKNPYNEANPKPSEAQYTTLVHNTLTDTQPDPSSNQSLLDDSP